MWTVPSHLIWIQTFLYVNFLFNWKDVFSLNNGTKELTEHAVIHWLKIFELFCDFNFLYIKYENAWGLIALY